MSKDMGASASQTGLSSPTEPCSTVSTLTGFDPSRMDAEWLVKLLFDYGGGYKSGSFCDSRTFRKRYPEFVAERDERKSRGDTPIEATCAALVAFAEAIHASAIEARSDATGTGAAEGESAAPEGEDAQ